MDKVIADLIEKTKRQKELVSNTEYMDWLYEFTVTHPKFTSTQWDYDSPKSIFDDDYEKVGMLTDFFVGVEDYCVRNMITSFGTSRDFSYVIKYKDKYFEVGVCIGQGAYNYVIASDSVTTEYILFESIMDDSKDYRLDIKQQKLNELQEVIKELKEVGAPLDVVLKTVKDTYK